MKKTRVGMWVTHFGRHGVVDSIGLSCIYAVVRFPSSDGFPFPQKDVVRISELKRYRQKKTVQTAEYEPAPF